MTSNTDLKVTLSGREWNALEFHTVVECACFLKGDKNSSKQQTFLLTVSQFFVGFEIL